MGTMDGAVSFVNYTFLDYQGIKIYTDERKSQFVESVYF